MDEIEKSLPIFRGRSELSDSGLREVLPELIGDALDLYLVKQFEVQQSHSSLHATYSDNFTFWKSMLSDSLFQGMRVRFQGFHLTEWLPSSPGRYYTPDARDSRLRARRFLNKRSGEYSLGGKELMIFGGVGSARLAANLSNKTYFLGASSTGITYQGIPVILPEEQYYQVIQTIKRHGGCLTNLVGTLQIFPPEKRLIQYPQKIEKYYLALDSVDVIRPSENDELMSAVAIAFQRNGRYDKAWSFCSFKPNTRIEQNSLENAVDWLRDYIQRYSEVEHPKLLSDFDELSKHFDFPIELPLFQRPSSEQILTVIEGYAPILRIGEERAIIIANIIGSVNMSTNNKPPNPWISGSYYLVVFLAALGAIFAVGRLLPLWALPIVIIGAILALSVIGAFQLRQDERLSEENFIKLMGLSLRSLAFIKPPSRKTDKSSGSSLPPVEPNSPAD